jgi:GT2 family glycosyltransferase
MMCEDYEYCLRIKKAGFKIGVMKNNHVNRLHLGSQRFSKATLWRGYYHSRNHYDNTSSIFFLEYDDSLYFDAIEIPFRLIFSSRQIHKNKDSDC